MPLLLTLVPLLLALTTGAASALDCAEAITTPEINECAAIEQQAVEKRLNAAYRKVLAYLDSAEPAIADDAARARARLVEAQRAWIRFREADCDALYELNASGTIRTVLWIGCMQSHAERRIEQLDDFMEGP